MYAITATLVVIAILALTVLSIQPFNHPTSSTSVSSSNAPSFQVLKTNVIVSSAIGCMVLEGIGHTCPTVTTDPFTTPANLKGVELITYQGTDYYAGNLSGFGSSGVWWSNSSIFCVSPQYGSYAACPVNESLPSVSWCSTAASQEDLLSGFRIGVQFDGSWNATAIGYSNSTANRAVDRCYWGNGSGWILVDNWNPNGGAILDLTVQKMDASSGNLTVTENGHVESTVAPYGAVTISQTLVP